ncbi:hypothetical protein DRQ50_01790 [bacterium]|nr:MAG: hypothetical protein DRQ50_01790 [bacterium]
MSGRTRKKPKHRKTGSAWYEAAWLTGLLLVASGMYLALSLTGGTGPWWLMVAGGESVDLVAADNPGGPVGGVLSLGLQAVFGGLWCWLVPVVLVVLGGGYLLGRHAPLGRRMLWVIPLWLVSAAWVGQPGGPLPADTGARLGGIVGFTMARGFHALFGLWGGRIFLSVFLLVAVVALLRPWLGPVVVGLGRVLAVLAGALVALMRGLFVRPWLAVGRAVGGFIAGRQSDPASVEESPGDPVETGNEPGLDPGPDPTRETRERVVHVDTVPEPEVAVEERNLPGANGAGDGMIAATDATRPPTPTSRPKKRRKGPVRLPGLDLLTPADPETMVRPTGDLDTAADLLEDTLRSFGVEGEVKDVRPGPVVTTFEYQPGAGIRVSQIVQRSDDLALAMRARSIRMEAPIPGKAAVGIEIPNPTARMVRLREVLEGTVEAADRPPLGVVLGKDVVGRPVSVDLAALPHLLVAGSTGSGKSVCLNAIICNLLLRNDPSRLRLVLIDPKMLEMNVYNGIPHLLLPVVTDPREALRALQWMVAQMELRYRQLAKQSVRNIQQYNDKVARGEVVNADGEKVEEPMPYFLTIVDELADLMIQMGGDFEGPITRLAQKARAVGIHLILATQRPSVDVLTGVIKANIPCRIAFRVIQKNDSRTVLDMNGAEKLLGHGDMLYLQPGRALPVRVHGSFIDVDECEAVAAHWRGYEGLTEEISLQGGTSDGSAYRGEDDLYDDAMRVVVLHQSGSTSLLQRRLRIGYTRAGRLMDMLEESGVVGPFTGSKARDVLVKPEDLPAVGEGEA